MRILCTGDLHLNERSWLGPEWLWKQADVWERICKLAVDEGVEALLFAGDAFEHRRPTPNEMRAFQYPLSFLAEADIPAVAICGNHDRSDADSVTALEVVTWESAMETMRYPAVWEREGFSVACLPWTPVSRLVALSEGCNRDDVHAAAADILVQTAGELLSRIDGTAILLGHWSVDRGSLPNGLPVADLRETIVPLDALEAQGWKAIVLGHIHAPQLFTPLNGTYDFYVGSPMALNFGEADTEHVIWMIDGFGVHSIPIEGPRFVTLDAEASYTEGLDNVAGDIFRLRPTAKQTESAKEWGRKLLDAGAHRVIVQPEVVRAQRARVEMDESVSELDALVKWSVSQDLEEPVVSSLVERTREYLAS